MMFERGKFMELLAVLTGTKKTLSALTNLYKGCIAVNNRFIIKKIEKFSEKTFDERKVKEFVNGIGIYRWEEIQDLVIHQLTQAESITKAGYERNLVEALLAKRISDAEFWRMNFVLQHLYTFDVGELIGLYDGKDCPTPLKDTFTFYGLLDVSRMHFEDGEALSFDSIYTITDFGKKFVESIRD